MGNSKAYKIWEQISEPPLARNAEERLEAWLNPSTLAPSEKYIIAEWEEGQQPIVWFEEELFENGWEKL